MQFEEFDKKIRDAADHHHPAYDENAWARMEKLLDKHLPRKDDDRRRIIFFILLFLLLAGGGFWFFSAKPWQANKQHVTTGTTVKESTAVQSSVSSSSDKENSNNITSSSENNNKIPGGDENVNTPSALTPSVQSGPLPGSEIKKVLQLYPSSGKDLSKKKIKAEQPAHTVLAKQDLTGKKLQKEFKESNQPSAETKNTIATKIIPEEKIIDKEAVAEKLPLVIASPSKKEEIVVSAHKVTDNKTTAAPNTAVQKIKEKSKKTNHFFFTLSAGPDVSATSGDKLGKIKLLGGAGVGYTFKERLTIRSGFYTGRKVYTASPESYNPPNAFWNYYPNMEKVEADCKVYEIPLSFSYHIGRTSKHNLFLSAGISSYLMKNETYNYYYKYTATGPTVTRKYSISDKNNHYFSVLTFSGGIQKNIGRSVTIMAEPYIKLPLSGVGFGKVKLNSGGILFSIGIRPFNNSKSRSNSPH